MASKLAFVRFKQDGVHWVVDIDEVKDFLPKHAEDFNPKSLYPTRWSHESEEEQFHDAHILCLGVDAVDIALKAKRLKKFNKLPGNIIAAFNEYQQKEKAPGTSKESKKKNKKESSKELNERESRRESVSRSRMKKAAEENKGEELKQKEREKVKKQRETDKAINNEGLAALLACKPDDGLETDLAVDSKEPLPNDGQQERSSSKPKEEASLRDNFKKKKSVTCSPDRQIKKQTKLKSPGPRSPGLRSPGVRSPGRKTPKKSPEHRTPMKSPVCKTAPDKFYGFTVTKETSTYPAKRLFRSEDSDVLAQPESKKVKVDSTSDGELNNPSKGVLNKTPDGSVRKSDESDSSDPEVLKDGQKERAKDSESDISPSVSSHHKEPSNKEEKNGKERWKDSTDDSSDSSVSYTPSEQHLQEREEKILQLNLLVGSLRRELAKANNEIEELRSINMDLQKKQYKAEKESRKAQQEKSANVSEDVEKKVIEKMPVKNECNKSKGNDKKIVAPSSAEKPKFKNNQEIADMLFDAIKNPEEKKLREQDEMVNMGNNVWVPREFFYNKLAKLSVRTSLAVGDLTEYIWGKKGCAERSLEGKSSPKNPTASRKQPATPAKKEVVLGFFRARKKVEGVEDKTALDCLVDVEGKKIVREKFSRIAKSLKKEKE